MKSITLSVAAAAIGVTALTACSTSETDSQFANTVTVPDYWPQIQSPITKKQAVEAKVEALLADMTVEQIVAYWSPVMARTTLVSNPVAGPLPGRAPAMKTVTSRGPPLFTPALSKPLKPPVVRLN